MNYRRTCILVIICLIFLASGCNLLPKGNKTEDASEIIEIEFWYGLDGYPNQTMKQFIEEFNTTQSKYSITGVVYPSHKETFKALKSAIARKKAPDVVLLENQHLYYLATKGVIQTLNNYVEEEIDTEDFIDSYYEQTEYQNRIIGLPMYGEVQVLYYRRDFFEENKLKSVDLLTWEALMDVAHQLTQKKGEEILVYGWEPMFGSENLIDAAISNGGKFISDSKEQVLINSEEWIDAWEFFRHAIHEDKVMKVHYGGEGRNHWYATIDDVMQGRAAGYIGSCGDKGDIDSTIIGSHMLPMWSGKRDNPRGVVDLHSLAIPIDVKVEKREGAIEWIKFLVDSDINLKWSIETGYVPVRKSSMDKDAFYDTVLENPDYYIPISQVKLGTEIFLDPTDGKIYELLEEAAYKVLILNIPSEEALNEAQKQAQDILDEMVNQGR